MKWRLILSLCFGIVFGATAFFALDHWLLGLGVGGVAMVTAFFYIIPIAEDFSAECRMKHECYLFIHSYLVSMSVSLSMDKSFSSASSQMGKEFHALDETLASMDAKEKVDYLCRYFVTPIYAMFLSVLELYCERGGDILRLSSELTAEASREERERMSYGKMATRKAFTFGFLWLAATGIMVFLRFGLSSFFSQLKTSWTYLGATLGFYLFFLASCCVYVSFHTGKKSPRLFKKEAKHVAT